MEGIMRVVTLSLCIYMMTSCASPKAPTGGPADTSPPTLIPEESTPNRQTLFNEPEIVLTFDEWVVLKDIYNQLVISPPMPDDPDVRQKGKSVIIDLPDSLREFTTYTINFGNAITDLNEGNVLDNFVFVFSTGPDLDSLSLRGSVADAVTLKPSPDVWIMLYKTGEDSAVYKRKPDYLTKSNKEGHWSVDFLRDETYEIVALKDENLNFLYDQEAELFGWFPEAVDAGDQLSELPTIMMFPREKRSILKDALHTEQGWLKLVIEGPLPKPVPMLVPAIDSSISMWRGDTLHIWYARQRNYSGQVIVNDDTTRIREAAKTPMTSQLTIRPSTGRIGPGGEVIFQVSVPALYYDTSKIVVAHDTIGTIPYTFREDTVDLRRFMIRAPWEETTRYKITFLPGAITDFWERSHDTIHHSVAVTAANQFGDLLMTIDNLDSTKTYLLLLKEGEQIIDTFVVENTSDIQVTKRGLLPAAYIIEIIEDLNRNGLWDTGDYDKQRQPERKMIFMPEKLRADWDQEVKMTWKR